MVQFSIGSPGRLEDWYGPELVALANPVLQASQTQVYFVANSSSYRALEASGLLNELADTRVKTLLYDYYRTVERIANIERDLNNVLRELSMDYRTAVGGALGMFVLSEPMVLWNNDGEDIPLVEERRRTYGELLGSVTAQALLSASAHQGLLQEYEHLLSLGRRLVAVLDEAADPQAASDEGVFAADNGRGFPVLLERGVPALHSLGLFGAPSCPDTEDCFRMDVKYLRLTGDALEVVYGGDQPWAFLYLEIGPIDIDFGRYSKDFSAYDRLAIDLRRAGECASVNLILKDVDDPDDGTESRVRVEPTSDWKTWVIDLDEFATADLARLSVFGFLFLEGGCHLATRDVRFLRPEPTDPG
jgi:hypothetical protein